MASRQGDKVLRIRNNEGVEVAVKFYHGEISGAFLDKDGKPPKRRYCEATADINGHIVGRGEAVCHPLDRYVRKEGRKKAFARLLANMDMIRPWREEAWERFFSYGRKPC